MLSMSSLHLSVNLGIIKGICCPLAFRLVFVMALLTAPVARKFDFRIQWPYAGLKQRTSDISMSSSTQRCRRM